MEKNKGKIKSRFLFVIYLVLLLITFFYVDYTQAGATVSFYSTLDSTEAITSPEIGPPASINAASFVEGYNNNAVHFDASATNENVSISGYGTFDSDSSGTYDPEGMVTFWFKPDSDMGTWAGKLFDTTSSTTRFTLYSEASHLRLYMRAGANVLGYYNTSDLTWQAGTWHHIRFWYKGDLATDNVRLWVDGVEVLANHNGTFAFAGTPTFTLGNGQGGAMPANGAIDDIKIYTSNDGTPSISSLSDNVISPGEQIVISGTNFGDNIGGGGSVSFQGTAAASIDSWSDTSITVTAPATFVDGQIVVTTYLASSAGADYTLAAGINNVYYASARETLLITGGKLGDTQAGSKVYLDNIDQGTADYWDANQIYLTGVATMPTEVKLEIGVDEITSSTINNLDLYSPYPYDDDINSANLISYWPFDDDWSDVKGTNEGTNRSTYLRPNAIFNKSLQTSQMISFEDNSYVAFGGLVEAANGDILAFSRNGESHFEDESKIEMRRSTDGGFTWSQPQVVVDNVGFDDRMDGDSLLLLPNGDIIFAFGKIDLVGTDSDTYIYASSDNGETWSVRTKFADQDFSPYPWFGRFSRPILLDSGRIMASVETSGYPGYDHIHVALYSDDNGYTWHPGGVITTEPADPSETPSTTLTADYTAGTAEMSVADASNLPTSGIMRISDGVNTEAFTYGYKDGNVLKNIYRGTTVTAGLVNSYATGVTVRLNPKKITESQIIKAPDDDTLMTFLRTSDPNYRIMYSYSYDQGTTWTTPQAMYFNFTSGEVVYGQAFRLHTDSSGRIYMFYRHDGYMLAYSDDNGLSWNGTNSVTKDENNTYLFNNSTGGYSSVIEYDDYLFMQVFREYNSGDYAYIEKTGLYKDQIGDFGNFVGVSPSASLQLNQFSVDFWFRLDDHWSTTGLNEHQTILAKRDATENSYTNINYRFTVLNPLDANANKLEFALTDSTNTYRGVYSNEALENGKWYHATGSYDGSTMKLYLDGVLQESFTTDLTTLESSPLNIGIYSVAAGSKFRGQIDNLKIWDRALTSSEILSRSNYALPYLDAVSPSSADRSTNLTITGYNFGNSQNDSTVTIGSDELTIVSWSNDEIIATIPSNASKGTGNLVVIVSGNASNSISFTVGVDPVISNINVSSVATDSATISWDTNEDADSLVYYGTTQIVSDSISNGSLSTSHKITLEGLSPNTKYYFKVSSTDSDGNNAITGDFYTFTTLALPQSEDDQEPETINQPNEELAPVSWQSSSLDNSEFIAKILRDIDSGNLVEKLNGSDGLSELEEGNIKDNARLVYYIPLIILIISSGALLYKGTSILVIEKYKV